MKFNNLKFILVFFLLLQIPVFGQGELSPSLYRMTQGTPCTVTATVLAANLQPLAGVKLFITATTVNGLLISSSAYETAASDANGIITFVVAQGGYYNIRGNLRGFTGAGKNIVIPSSSTATLESLVSVAAVPIQGMTLKEEGVALSGLYGTVNFVGSGITAVRSSAGIATITIASDGQPLDADLTAIAGLTPANDDIIQRKSGAWANRTLTQLKTDLLLSGTNTGDQPIGGVSGDIQYNSSGVFAGSLLKQSTNIIQQRNGLNPETFEVYADYVNTSNYSRIILDAQSGFTQLVSQRAGTGGNLGTFYLGTETTGGGAGTGAIYLKTGGVDRWMVQGTSQGHFVPALDNTYDLGTPSSKVRTGYFNSLSFDNLTMAGTPQTLTGAGVVNLTTFTTLLVTTAANALTLTAGSEGQYKFIRMKTDGGDGTLTVTNLQGGATITFNDVGDFVYLFYQDGKWHILTNSGCLVT